MGAWVEVAAGLDVLVGLVALVRVAVGGGLVAVLVGRTISSPTTSMVPGVPVVSNSRPVPVASTAFETWTSVSWLGRIAVKSITSKTPSPVLGRLG